eukprot:g20430.t1
MLPTHLYEWQNPHFRQVPRLGRNDWDSADEEESPMIASEILNDHSDDSDYTPSAEATESEQKQKQRGCRGSECDDGQVHDVDKGLVSEDENVSDEVSGDEEEEVATRVESEEGEYLPASKFKDSKQWKRENAVQSLAMAGVTAQTQSSISAAGLQCRISSMSVCPTIQLRSLTPLSSWASLVQRQCMIFQPKVYWVAGWPSQVLQWSADNLDDIAARFSCQGGGRPANY